MKITINDIFAPALTGGIVYLIIYYLISPDFFSMSFSSTEKSIEYIIVFSAIYTAVYFVIVALKVSIKRVI